MPAAPRTGPRGSVRARILGWVLALTALGMLVAATLSYAVQLEEIRGRVDDALVQEVSELRQFAEGGVDPATGQPFASLDALFLVALQRNVPDANETFLTLVDGEVRYVPRGERPFAPEDDPAFLALLRAAPPDAPATLRTGSLEGREVRYASVPVRIEGTEQAGSYVVVYDLQAEQAQATTAVRRAAVVNVLSLLLVGLVGWTVAGRLLRPLRLLRETARRISDTDLHDRIPVQGGDEVSDLAETFNAMLDRLQASFEEQRRFMDDAGHELRTPVTILQGHLELMDPHDPDEVAETRALLLDETHRMSGLVEDLVLLARSRRPDFTTPVPVHVGQLLDGVMAKATALGARRWTLDAAPDQTVHADPQRLTQALLQLASNAVRHTEDGDVVALGGSVDATTVRLWVRDTGSGIDPADHERVFQRFARAGSGRGADGSGLGLAIVTAIAQGHGGRVDLASRRGEGATFTLELPLRAAPAPRPAGDRPAVGAS